MVAIRTLSKWCGLAGLRAGYGIFPEWLAARLLGIKPAYAVNVAAEAAGIASLNNLPELRRRVGTIKRSRERLFDQLESLQLLKPHPSQANFIYCTGNPSVAAKEAYDYLLTQGILVRFFSDPPAMRITVGTDQENERLMGALHQFEAERL